MVRFDYIDRGVTAFVCICLRLCKHPLKEDLRKDPRLLHDRMGFMAEF